MKKRDVVVGAIIVVVLIVLAIILINYFRGSVKSVGDELGIELYSAPDDGSRCYGYGKGYGEVCEEGRLVIDRDGFRGLIVKKTNEIKCGPCLRCGSYKNDLRDEFINNIDPSEFNRPGILIYERICVWESAEGITSFTCDDDCRDGKKSNTKSRCIKVNPNSPKMECRLADCSEDSKCEICQKCDKINTVNAIGEKVSVCRDLGQKGYEDDKTIPPASFIGQYRCSGNFIDGIAQEDGKTYTCKKGECKEK